ncbi:MAG: hypothetical protein WCA46_25915 [Actinocatenispora sp.]
MRQSLSEQRVDPRTPAPRDWRPAARALTVAVALSAVLVVATVIDQIGVHSLTDHAAAMYAPSGRRAAPGLLYGLVYTVAVVGVLLWLPVLRVVRSRRRGAPALAITVVVVTGALAALLLGSTEYGARIFPPVWGILAALPAVAGILAVVLLLRGQGQGQGGDGRRP